MFITALKLKKAGCKARYFFWFQKKSCRNYSGMPCSAGDKAIQKNQKKKI